ncbi:hypothetical protein E4T44_12367 [Aureobasidium sp. EXF-8845]|nr:hypothetical protein E4T45_12228 [Aureobasidium sp. EXF-8846]KAI4795436.1 hypothetical protein E4T44_12367 [Aureobasidium sp. EXF-8845]
MSAIQQSPERRPRALADIHYNNLINDTATSSEDEAPEIRAIAPAEVESLVGVSLGRAQTRLILPQTPAAEKQAAIDEQGGFFGGPQIQDDADLDDDDVLVQDAERRSRPVTRERPVVEERTTTGYRAPATTTGQPTVRLPSPWRAGPKKFKKRSESRSILKDGFHRRASSTDPGPMSGMGASLDNWRDALRTSIHNFTSPFSTQHPLDADGKTRAPNRQRRSGSLFASFSSLSSSPPTQTLPVRPRTQNSSASTLVNSRPQVPRNITTSSLKESQPVNLSHEPPLDHTLQHPKTMPMERDPPSNESNTASYNPQFIPIRPASSKTGQPESALSPMARNAAFTIIRFSVRDNPDADELVLEKDPDLESKLNPSSSIISKFKTKHKSTTSIDSPASE